VTQRQIDMFAEATGDYQWIHTDPDRAKLGPFHATVAQSSLALALAPAMLAELIMVPGTGLVINYGVDKVRFLQPISVNSLVRGHVRLISARDHKGDIEAGFGLTIELEDIERPACVAEIVTLYRWT
jgi:acyl dehydratase